MALLSGCAGLSRRDAPTRIAEIQGMSPVDVREGRVVHVAGVVTFREGQSDSCIVQDSSGGVLVLMLPGQSHVAASQMVDVSGVLTATGSAAEISRAQVRVLPGNLPAPPEPLRLRTDAQIAAAFNQTIAQEELIMGEVLRLCAVSRP